MNFGEGGFKVLDADFWSHRCREPFRYDDGSLWCWLETWSLMLLVNVSYRHWYDDWWRVLLAPDIYYRWALKIDPRNANHVSGVVWGTSLAEKEYRRFWEMAVFLGGFLWIFVYVFSKGGERGRKPKADTVTAPVCEICWVKGFSQQKNMANLCSFLTLQFFNFWISASFGFLAERLVGPTPLLYAVAYNRSSVIPSLLDQRADINHQAQPSSHTHRGVGDCYNLWRVGRPLDNVPQIGHGWPDKRGFGVLHIAAHKDLSDLFSVLTSKGAGQPSIWSGPRPKKSKLLTFNLQNLNLFTIYKSRIMCLNIFQRKPR